VFSIRPPLCSDLTRFCKFSFFYLLRNPPSHGNFFVCFLVPFPLSILFFLLPRLLCTFSNGPWAGVTDQDSPPDPFFFLCLLFPTHNLFVPLSFFFPRLFPNLRTRRAPNGDHSLTQALSQQISLFGMNTLPISYP